MIIWIWISNLRSSGIIFECVMNIWLTIGVAYAILTLSAMVWIIVGHVKNKKLKDAMEKHRQGLRIEDSLPNDIYTEIAKKFAFCRYNQDFSTLRPFLSENVKLIIYKHKELSGIADFESYWIDKEKRLKHDCINVRTSIKFCNYYSHVAVYDQILSLIHI